MWGGLDSSGLQMGLLVVFKLHNIGKLVTRGVITLILRVGVDDLMSAYSTDKRTRTH